MLPACAPHFVSHAISLFCKRPPTAIPGWTRTRFDVPMRVALDLARGNALLAAHQWPLLLRLVILVGARSFPPFVLVVVALGRHDIFVDPVYAHLHPLAPGTAGAPTTTTADARVHVHLAQRLAHTQEELQEALLGELGVVDQVRVDQVLQVAPPVVREQHVDGLGGLAAAALRGDRVVDAVDDARGVGKELVGVDFLHRLGDRLGAEGASDLLKGEKLRGRGVLYEVDVGETALKTDEKVRSVSMPLVARVRRGGKTGKRTSPSNLRILKLRLLILRVGEPGKQFRQFPKEVTRSRRTCAMVEVWYCCCRRRCHPRPTKSGWECAAGDAVRMLGRTGRRMIVARRRVVASFLGSLR